VLHRVSSLRGNGAAVLSNKDCCEGSCVHQELSGSGLRHGVHHHVAGWIRPRLQVTFFALLVDFYLDRLVVKDRDKTHRITGVILIMWYQITGFITVSIFC
jgi:hypothetical protein